MRVVSRPVPFSPLSCGGHLVLSIPLSRHSCFAFTLQDEKPPIDPPAHLLRYLDFSIPVLFIIT